MIKIIIADDEKIIRERLVVKIDWELLGYEVVGQASNGLELFEKTVEKRPDVVITDIRMPEMDGVEFVEKLKNANISTEIIAISGYSKFEYAHKLMNMGVYAYLLKPIDKSELYKYLTALRDKIRSKKGEDFSKKIREIRNSVMCGESLDITLISDITKPVFVCVVFNDSESGLDMQRKKIPECFSMFFKNSGIVFENEKTLAFLCESDSDTKIEQTLFQLIEYLENGNTDKFDFKCMSVYYSSVIENESDFESGLEKIKLICNMTPFAQIGGIYNMFALDVEERTNQYVCPHDTEREIINLLNAGDTEKLKEKIIDIHTEMIDERVSFLGIKRCYFYLLNSIYRNLTETNKVNSKVKGDIFTALEKMEKIEYVNSLQEYITEVVKDICKEVSTITDGYLNIYFEKAIEYMNNHFGENFSMRDVAEYLGVSYGYLGYIFKQNGDKGFVRLLRDIRIKEAKHLLAETDSKVYEISDLCGFENSRYFSEIFRHETGVNPLEYRKKNRKN